MTIQTHTVLQKLCLGIKITTRQGNYVTLLRCYVWMFVRRSRPCGAAPDQKRSEMDDALNFKIL